MGASVIVIAYRTFPELAQCWIVSMAHLTESSRERYTFALASLGKYFQSLNGGLVESIEKWQRIRRKETSAATFNMEKSVLVSVLDYGVQHGRPKVNPAGEVRKPTNTQKRSVRAFTSRLRTDRRAYRTPVVRAQGIEVSSHPGNVGNENGRVGRAKMARR